MEIGNILQINDWNIKKFLLVILFFQLIAWATLILNDQFNIVFPRQLIWSIYLLFIPGILIVRIFKLHKIGNIETLLYSLGLSISFLMVIGLILNYLLPPFGINYPLSTNTLIISISFLVLVLCIISYFRDYKYSEPEIITINLKDVYKPAILCLVPFLSFLGTYIMNTYELNYLNIFLIIVISILVLFTTFNVIKKKYYPLTVFVISISLLYFTSLISTFVWGQDIFKEYSIALLVIKNSLWDPSINNNLNGILSIIMLAPIISKITNMNLEWIFKIIYPFIYAFVPLCLYIIFKKQTNAKIAFLAVFYVMATFSFFGEMNSLARQQIAELFFVLLILLITKKDMPPFVRSSLLIIFGFSLVVSHYSLSYIFMFLVISSGIMIYLLRFYRKSIIEKTENRDSDIVLSITFILFFVILVLAWYMYVSSASSLESIVKILNNIYENISSDFLSPDAVQPLNLLTRQFLPFHQITKYLLLISQAFIGLGILSSIIYFFKNRNIKMDKEYWALSLCTFILLILLVLVPNLSNQLQTTRFLHIAQLVLAPFCILGFIEIFNILGKLLRTHLQKNSLENLLQIFSIFLVIYFLFNSGLVYELMNEKETAASLISFDSNFDYTKYNYYELSGSDWIIKNNENYKIFADDNRALLIYSRGVPENAMGLSKISRYINNTKNSKNMTNISFYIFFGSYNIKNNAVYVSTVSPSGKFIREYKSADSYINNTDNKIYDNGGSLFYFVQNL